MRKKIKLVLIVIGSLFLLSFIFNGCNWLGNKSVVTAMKDLSSRMIGLEEKEKSDSIITNTRIDNLRKDIEKHNKKSDSVQAGFNSDLENLKEKVDKISSKTDNLEKKVVSIEKCCNKVEKKKKEKTEKEKPETTPAPAPGKEKPKITPCPETKPLDCTKCPALPFPSEYKKYSKWELLDQEGCYGFNSPFITEEHFKFNTKQEMQDFWYTNKSYFGKYTPNNF